MEGETQEKLGFFKRIILSIKDFEIYQYFASEKISIALSYILRLICIFVIIITLLYTYKFYQFTEELKEYFVNELPNFTYESGNLTIESNDVITVDKFNDLLGTIIIAPNVEQEDSYIEKIEEYSNAILILKNRAIIKNDVINQNLEYSYEEIANTYSLTSFNKQDAINYLQNTNMSMLYSVFTITLFVYLYIIYVISSLGDALILAILGNLIARFTRMKMLFKANFNIGIYALTLPIILNIIYTVVNTLTGFEIQAFNWMYTTISCIYVIVAILIIKTDFINKQMELMKIVEEQERVREEMKQREEEKKQEEKNDQEKPESEPEDESKPKEKKKDKNLPEEPEGSNA